MTRSARQVMEKAASEDDLLVAITDALTLFQYRWSHVRRSDKAIGMGHAGFPDIVAARKGVVWFIELKSERGRLDPEQFAWFHALGWLGEPDDTKDAGNVRLRVWFPSDQDRAVEELR